MSKMQKFANGGLIGGTSTTGDHNVVRANAGEMVLTKSQQGNLWSIINGKGGVGGKVDFEIKGDRLVGVLRNHGLRTRG